jgi:hypothetical protein
MSAGIAVNTDGRIVSLPVTGAPPGSRGVTIDAIHTAAAALDAMPDQPERAMTTLANLCVRHNVTV